MTTHSSLVATSQVWHPWRTTCGALHWCLMCLTYRFCRKIPLLFGWCCLKKWALFRGFARDGGYLEVLQHVFFVCPAREKIVSLPVKAWKAGKASRRPCCRFKCSLKQCGRGDTLFAWMFPSSSTLFGMAFCGNVLAVAQEHLCPLQRQGCLQPGSLHKEGWPCVSLFMPGFHINLRVRQFHSVFIAKTTSNNNGFVLGCFQNELLSQEPCRVCFVFLMSKEVLEEGHPSLSITYLMAAVPCPCHFPWWKADSICQIKHQSAQSLHSEEQLQQRHLPALKMLLMHVALQWQCLVSDH